MTRLAAILILGSLGASAQTVEGTVTNAATKAGVAGARVSLQQGASSVYSTTADAQGRFRFDDVKDGSYSANYWAERYRLDGAPIAGRPFQVKAGGAPVRIEGRLIPYSRVSGHVIDGRGDAVVEGRVRLIGAQVDWIATTDAQGNFDEDSLMPGAYTLLATPPPGWKLPDPDPKNGQPRGWGRIYYPGVARPEMAAPLTLQPGSEIRDLEIRIPAVPAHAVHGVLLNPDGTPAPKVTLLLGDPVPGPAERAESKADGSFDFPAVVDGDWRLIAETSRGGVRLQASQWIEMAGRDGDVTLRLSPPFSVSVRVILETRPGLPEPKRPGVSLMEQRKGRFGRMPNFVTGAQRQADGTLRFEDVYPGSYGVSPGAAPPLYYLDSVRLGETPVAGNVELSAASPDLTVAYKTNGGTVHGAVEQCGAGRVWLVPQDPSLRGPGRSLMASCEGAPSWSGRYAIGAIRPGDYYALALAGPRDLEHDPDPAVLQMATRVTVRAGEATQVDLALSGGR